jgi:hypothetical protein
MLSTRLPLFAALALLAHPTFASDLKLDGQTAIDVQIGSSFQVDLTGNPGLPAFVFYDFSPGPVMHGGELVPLGLTPNLTLLVSGATDGSGLFSTPYFVPNDPRLANLTLYLAGGILDPTDPNGVDVSNGASLHFVPKIGAGAAQATLVGRETILDGSGALDPGGVVPLGVSFNWFFTGRPAGSGATLIDPTSAFPSFVPDVPGDYSIDLVATQAGAISQATTTVHAYDVTLSPGVDGSYVLTPFASLLGSVAGPDLAGTTLLVEGATVAMDGAGGFGPVNASFASGAVFRPVEIELRHSDGSATRDRVTAAQGLPLPLTFPSVQGLSAHLTPGGLSDLSDAAEDELLAADLAGILLAIPPTTIADTSGPFGITIFSATVEFTSVSYDQTNANLSLTPQSGSLGGLAQLFNVYATFNVTGEILEVDYDLDGDISTSPADLSATIVPGVSGGALTVDVQNPTVNLNNFNFNLNGFFGDVAELFIIESWVRDTVEDAIEAEICNLLGPSIEEILSAYVISLNLFDTLEVDVSVDSPFSSVTTTTNGVTLRLDGYANIDSAEPGSPLVTQYRSTITSAPPFPGTTPALGASYDGGLAMADDFLNQVLAASTGAGLLNGDMAELFAADPTTGQTFTTDVLDALFPGAGFGNFPAGTVVDLIASGTMPPIVRTTPGGPSLGVIDMADLEIVFQVRDGGAIKPLMVVSLDAGAEIDLTIGSAGELVANLGNSTVAATVLQGFPGSDLSILSAGVTFLAGVIVPQLSTLLSGIPLPSLEAAGLSISPKEIGLAGGGSEHVTFYGDLSFTSP